MPSSAATASMAARGSQPPFCSCARQSSEITAEAWRPSGYLAIWVLAHSAFSGENAKLSGCSEAGASLRFAIASVLPIHFAEHDVERAEHAGHVG